MLKLVTILLVGSISTPLFAVEKVTMAADPWCPYTCEPGDAPGIVVEVVQKVLEAKGYKLDYKIMTWEESLKQAREGKIDGALGAGSGDAQDLILVSPEISSTRYCFFKKPGSKWTFSSLKALEEVKLAIIKDYTFGDAKVDDYVAKNSSDSKRIEVVSGDDALKQMVTKTSSGGSDILIEDFNVMKYFLKKNPEVKLQSAGCLTQEKVSVALSKKTLKSGELNRIISDGVKELKANGEIQKIQAKYGI